MPRSKKHDEACVYCGSAENITREHVPPKMLFPKPRPSDLITVPACQSCNASFKNDQEYFWTRVGLEERAGAHPAARSLNDKIFRTFDRPEATGFRRQFLNSINTVDVVSPGGVHLGQQLSYDVDLTRLNRVAKLVVTGLHFHERGTRIHDGYTATAFSESGFADADEAATAWIRPVIDQLMEAVSKTVGDNVLSYRFSMLPDDPHSSVWLLTFYGTIRFLGMIIGERRM